jgi:hypothetical protein
MYKKYIIAWEDERGTRNWEMVKSKRELGEIHGLDTLDGAGMAIQYEAIVTSTTICPSLLRKARKANPRKIDLTKIACDGKTPSTASQTTPSSRINPDGRGME